MAGALVTPPPSASASSIATASASLSPLTRSLPPSSHRPHVPLSYPGSLILRSHFFSWQARSHLGSLPLAALFIPRDLEIVSKVRKAQHVIQASLLGVGAPEALVIAVVALLVFGPKGLAEVARTLGKSLRAFQPTIKELQQISRDFKDTLEQEIGLDELRETQPSQPVPKSDSEPMKNGSVDRAYSTEDYLRVTQEQAMALVPEKQRKAAEVAAWGGAPPVPGMLTEQVEASSDLATEPGQELPILKVETEEGSRPSNSAKVETEERIQDPKEETRSDGSNVQ